MEKFALAFLLVVTIATLSPLSAQRTRSGNPEAAKRQTLTDTLTEIRLISRGMQLSAAETEDCNVKDPKDCLRTIRAQRDALILAIDKLATQSFVNAAAREAVIRSASAVAKAADNLISSVEWEDDYEVRRRQVTGLNAAVDDCAAVIDKREKK